MNKERKRKPIGRYLLFVWILFLYIFACYYALHFNKQDLTTNANVTLPQDFRSRLKRHGLSKQISVIEIINGKLYFYRDGKRCKF
jgi:dolichyl-phosphate-mannose--protein O-mannosyl transferase